MLSENSAYFEGFIFHFNHLHTKLCAHKEKAWLLVVEGPSEPSLEAWFSHWEIHLPAQWATIADREQVVWVIQQVKSWTRNGWNELVGCQAWTCAIQDKLFKTRLAQVRLCGKGLAFCPPRLLIQTWPHFFFLLGDCLTDEMAVFERYAEQKPYFLSAPVICALGFCLGLIRHASGHCLSALYPYSSLTVILIQVELGLICLQDVPELYGLFKIIFLANSILVFPVLETCHWLISCGKPSVFTLLKSSIDCWLCQRNAYLLGDVLDLLNGWAGVFLHKGKNSFIIHLSCFLLSSEPLIWFVIIFQPNNGKDSSLDL